MSRPDPKVGDKVYCCERRFSRNDNYYATVTLVGRKHFYFDRYGRSVRVERGTWKSTGFRIYASVEEYESQQELEQLRFNVRDQIPLAANYLTADQCRRILEIIGENSQ